MIELFFINDNPRQSH